MDNLLGDQMVELKVGMTVEQRVVCLVLTLAAQLEF